MLPTGFGLAPGAYHASVDFQDRFMIGTHRLTAGVECLTKAEAGSKSAGIRDTIERCAVEDRRGKWRSDNGSWALLR